ncbi:hypothetical protein Tco_0642968 [Tanacetum coccineum]
MNKCLDSLPHLIADEARLEKLKYVAKGEPRQTPTFGMPIPEAMMSDEIKESQAYVNYLNKYPHAQSGSSTPRHGMGKGLMRRSDIPTPNKKKDVVPRRKRSITVDDNILSNPNEAFEYDKEVSVVLESPYHSSSFDDSSESANDDKTDSERDSDHDESDNESELGDESDKSTSDEESDESDNDESDKDYENDNNQTEDFVMKPHDKEPEQPPKEFPTPSHSVTTTSAEDYTRYLNDLKDVQISELLNEPLCTEATTMTVSPILETIHETQEQVTLTPPATPPTKIKKKRAKTLVAKAIKKKNDWKKVVMQRLSNLEQKNHAVIIEESVQANVLNEVKNQLAKFLPNAVFEYVQPRLEKMKMLYDMMPKNRSFLAQEKHLELYNALMNSMGIDESAVKGDTSSQQKRSHDGQDPPEDREGEKRRKRRRKDAEQEHEVQTEEVLGKDNPNWFQKIVKEPPKIFKKDKIIKEDVKGLAFELLKGTCKNNIELEYNMEQYHLALTDRIDWTNPKGGIFHHDLKADFPNLNQNDIEDLYLLKIQNKIRNIKGVEEYDRINALKMYIHRIVIKKRVEDV